MSVPGLLEAAPSGLKLVIQPNDIGLVYPEDHKWRLTMGNGYKSKPGWRKVLGEFGSRAAAQKEAQRLGFGSVMYRAERGRRWTRIYLHPQKNWHRLYRKRRV